MSLQSQAVLFPVSIEARTSDYALEQSLRKIGSLRPALKWEGRIIDGSRRAKILERVDFQLQVRTFDDRIDAARALYQIHPRRAFLLFASPGMLRHDLAWLFGISKHELPTTKQLKLPSKPKHQRGGVQFYRDKAFIGGIPIERDKLERAKKVCRERGVSFASWIRAQIESELLSG